MEEVNFIKAHILSMHVNVTKGTSEIYNICLYMLIKIVLKKKARHFQTYFQSGYFTFAFPPTVNDSPWHSICLPEFGGVHLGS
jgi:hypothetical protein